MFTKDCSKSGLELMIYPGNNTQEALRTPESAKERLSVQINHAEAPDRLMGVWKSEWPLEHILN